jgi:hypothetical protein
MELAAPSKTGRNVEESGGGGRERVTRGLEGGTE